MGTVRDNTEHPGPRLPWAGKQIRTEQAEQELSYLWRMAADNVRISHNINVRTSVLNLVICAPDIASAQRASLLIRDLSSTHIARVTLLILDTRSLPSGISTWVTLRSFPIISDMMRHHFEQITVLATGSAVYDSAYLLPTLLKTDLPVYLWWLSDPPADNTLFSRLINLTSRVIVDSSSFLNPTESIQTLSSLLQASPNSALSDLNWGHITPWRELIAQFFDMPEYRPYLMGVNQIDIEHAIPPAEHARVNLLETSLNPIQALLLAAWLKTRLGWQLSPDETLPAHNPTTGVYAWQMARLRSTVPLSGSGRTAKLAANTQGRISIRTSVQPDLRPGSLCLVRLNSTYENKRAIFTINRADDPDHVVTSVELDQRPRPTRAVSIAAAQKESELLHNELEIMSRDHLYEEILHEVFALLAQ